MSKHLFKGGDLSKSVLERAQSSGKIVRETSTGKKSGIALKTAQNFTKDLSNSRLENLACTDRVASDG